MGAAIVAATTTAREQLNGTAVRTALHTAVVLLDGGYDGWAATMRVNPAMRVMEELRSGETARYRAGLAEVIFDWNFVDDEGKSLPLPRDGLDWDALPFDLEARLVQAYGAAIEARTAVPKGIPTTSEPTSSSVG